MTVNTAGTTSFNGSVSNLNLLTTDIGGVTGLSGNITVGGNVALGDNVTLGQDVTMTSTAPLGNVTFGQALNGGFNLTVNAYNTSFAGNIGLVTPLAGLTTDFNANGATRLGSGVVSVNVGELVFNDNVTVAANVTYVASNLTFARMINPTAAGTMDVVFNVSNNVNLASGFGNTTAFRAISSDTPGIVNLSGTIQGANVAINDNLTLTGDSLVSGTSNASFGQKIDGGFNLTVNAISTSFNGSLGSVTPLANLLTDTNGTTRFNNTLGSTSVIVNNNIVLGDNITTGANITFFATNMTAARAINSMFMGAFDANFSIANNLSLSSAGNTTSFNNITLDAGTRILLAGSIVANDTVWAKQNVVLNAATNINGTLNTTFDGTIDGDQVLTVNAINTTFNGNIGTITPLSGLVTNAAGNTTLGLVAPARTIAVFANNMAFNDNIALQGDFAPVAIVPTGNITFGQGLDGAYNVTLTAFNTAFSGNIGTMTPLLSLTTDSNGTTRFTGGSNFVNVAELEFDDNVSFASNITLISTNLTFFKGANPFFTVDIAINSSHEAAFLAGFGAATAFRNVTIDAAGTLFLNGSIRGNNLTFGENIAHPWGHHHHGHQ